MKEKIERVVNSCFTLSQLWSASNYVVLSAQYTEHYEYGIMLIRNKLEKMTGAHIRNAIDYTAYAEHLLHTGNLGDWEIFCKFANIELDKIENFYDKATRLLD